MRKHGFRRGVIETHSVRGCLNPKPMSALVDERNPKISGTCFCIEVLGWKGTGNIYKMTVCPHVK